ncbi:hypothetical protein [Arthrobacter burdickii]|uniref:Tat pathway signal sequence domain protein n=1 Tax=Arthrobacter burdickii TaxID=3035920 RepID=A0ABT8K617_9MICC|nr:hypothetical protein [Arthrobacter burdickii]MDN4611972.1 hypothetical protein [Arthrobacter burdickii]
METPTRRQLRLQQPQGRAAAPPAGSLGEPLPGGRRDRRRQLTTQLAAVGAAATPSTGAVAETNAGAVAETNAGAVAETNAGAAIATNAGATAETNAGATAETNAARTAHDMSIEEALAARTALVGDAGEQADGTPRDGAFAVDPAVLAQQKALAERAAALTARARRTQEVSEQHQERTPAPHNPAAPDNLSIVAPPEFVQPPGAMYAVLRAPSTSLIPVVLPQAQQSSPGSETEGTPLGARDAFGLEPLDAMTAGLGRLRRLRYIQYSLLGVGAAALVTGIIMTVSSLNG